MSIKEPPGGWLNDISETILEILHVSGAIRLDGLQEAVSSSRPATDASYTNLLYSLRQLRLMGLVDQETGRFSLSDAGRAYLSGDIDPESMSYGLDRFEGTVERE